MEYPTQEHESKTTTIYIVHRPGNLPGRYFTLKEARELYHEELSKGNSSMITKKVVQNITLVTHGHVQGNL